MRVYYIPVTEDTIIPVEKNIAFPNISHAMLTDISLLYMLAFKTERQNKEEYRQERAKLAEEILSWVRNTWE